MLGETRYLMAIMPGQVDRQTRKEALERELGEEVTCDGLTRDFVMFQRRRGHRHSTDDLLTAWYAAAHLPSPSRKEPPRLLDLGSGIGSIGLAVLWAALQETPDTRLTAIEAQELSARFLRENVDANDVSRETRVIHGDLRDASLLADGTTFDLITGSPPYFDVKNGIVSADSQRAHARFELRGDVREYARAAARWLSPHGAFVLCFPTVQKQRVLDAGTAAGLHLRSVRDVVPKEGTAALFSLFAYVHAAAANGAAPSLGPDFVVRDRSGAHTPALTAARARFGLCEPP
jgi:tRNA1(Val) A37 N6-methylase TrmN6